ncbi:MAG: ubiquinone biosynthesis protein [Bacteriovoracaceae bacterium]|jgi:ubiquinone biosynthesis protein
MDIIKTGRGITNTIRNVNRLKEIVLIFTRHGFDEFITLGVTSKIPNFVLPKSRRSIKKEMSEVEEKDWSQVVGFRLRKCFEELGPAFIKFGQLLSSREDIFDASFIDEMKILRDRVKPIEFSNVREEVEQSLGKPIEEVFESVDESPIGTASIGVVYKGVLKTGEKVVLKVRRPNIVKEMNTDFSILLFLATQVERASEELKYLGISRLVNDFSITLQTELDFHIEALNCERFKKNVEIHDKKNILYIPKMYTDLCSERFLVMELLDGIPFSNKAGISPRIDELKSNLTDALQIFIKTFLMDGFFHGDLHGGNFFLMKNDQIGIIDFGLMGRLSKKGRKNFVAILYSLITYNFENLVYEFLDVADYEKIPDVDELIADVRDGISPFIGLTVQQTNYTHLFQVIIETLRRHKLFLPREWFVVFRSLMTLDGVGKDMEIDFDIFSMVEDDLQEIIKESYNKEEIIEEAIWTGRDFLSSSRMFPRHLRWFLREWSRKGYAFEIIHKGHEKQVKDITSSIIFLGYILLGAVFFVSGVSLISGLNVTHWTHIPTLCWIFWAIGLLSLLKGSLTVRKI